MKTTFENRRGRLLVVNTTRWKYRVGRRGGVIAISEHGRRIFAHANDITNRDFFRGQWKKTRDGMVLPGDVAKHIANHE